MIIIWISERSYFDFVAKGYVEVNIVLCRLVMSYVLYALRAVCVTRNLHQT
jgi:hypothetical protein